MPHCPTAPAHAARAAAPRPARLLRWLCALSVVALAACGGGEPDAPAQASAARERALAAGTASQGGVLINEVMAGAWKGAVDEDGDSEDWVEIYNPGTAAVNLSGYGLSNKAASPFFWTFPAGTTVAAKGYLTVWLSKKDRNNPGAALHANFDLDNGGDTVFLSASNATATGILVDSATPPLLRADNSWCRLPNGAAAAAFVVCAQPTRNAANAGTNYPGILAKPKLSVPSGFYATAQTLTITGPAGATLRYTTDGTEPTAASPAYTAPLNIGSATALRVAAFSATDAPSLVETGTYVVDAALAPRYAGGLKAMLVTMAPNDQTAYQANDKTRDFRANFELVTGGTTSVFKMDAEGSAGGQLGSGSAPNRIMNVKAVDAFGAKSFPGVLWADKPGIKSSKKLRLRNASNDWNRAHLRDQLSQKLGVDGPNIISSSTSVAMFINGRYYGLMDLREREEETIPAANLGVDKDYVDYIYDPLLGAQEIKNGGAAALANYQGMHNFITGNDMTVAANYARAKTLMNPESLAYDWAIHMFHANYDWPGRNVHVWRSPEVDGRWNWRAHDMDFAFGLYTGVGYNMNGSYTAGGSQIMSSLLRNTEFRNLYLNTVADQMNVMTPAYMRATLDGMANEMRPYIADYFAKAGLGTTTDWEARLNEIRTWFDQREPIYDGHNRTQFNLAARQSISVSVNDLSMGSVKVNSVDTQKYVSATAPTWSGRYYPGVPITLEARPKPGYAFVGWQGASTATTPRITQTLVAGVDSAAPPANAVACAAENQTCVLPAGATATIWYGAATSWQRLQNATGSVACNNATFGDPLQGTVKRCVYTLGAAATQLQLTAVFAASTPPAAPTLAAVAAQAWRTGDIAKVQLSATDPGGFALTYAAKALPKGLNINPATGVIYGRFTTPGTYNSTLSATNGTASATQAVVWTVTDRAGTGLLGTSPDSGNNLPNAVPTVSLTAPTANATVVEGGTVTLSASATDSDGSIARVEFYDGSTLLGAATASPYTLAWPNAALGSHTLSARAVDNLGAVGSSATVVVNVVVAAPQPPAAAVNCAAENQTCTLPAGSTATVWFGANASWIQRVGLSGAVACNNATFGDPLPGAAKSCRYVVTATAPANQPPTVALTSPAASAQFDSGSVISLTADAADGDGSVVRVDFYDGNTLIGSDSTAPYSLAWAQASVGAHSLSARAVDNSGAVTSSAAVAVTVVLPASAPGTGTGLLGRYYANNSLSGAAVLQRVEAVNFNWGLASPATGVPADNFSARWVGEVEAPVGGSYQFQTASDDGVRLWVNGQLVVNNWTVHSTTVDTSPVISLTAGQRVRVVLEYQEATGFAVMQLLWKTPGDAAFAAVPASRLYAPTATSGTGLRGQYYATADFTTPTALTRNELPAINLAAAAAPVAGFGTSNWAVRWEGVLRSPLAGAHALRATVRTDDGLRMWVNGTLVIDNWAIPSTAVRTATINLPANGSAAVRIEFFDQSAAASLALAWQTPGSTTFQALPLYVLSPQ